jgi:hypothetical protein
VLWPERPRLPREHHGNWLMANDACGSKAPFPVHAGDFRSYPESGNSLALQYLSLRAMCGRLRVGKGFLHECRIGRCGHVFGLSARFT